MSVACHQLNTLWYWCGSYNQTALSPSGAGGGPRLEAQCTHKIAEGAAERKRVGEGVRLSVGASDSGWRRSRVELNGCECRLWVSVMGGMARSDKDESRVVGRMCVTDFLGSQLQHVSTSPPKCESQPETMLQRQESSF